MSHWRWFTSFSFTLLWNQNIRSETKTKTKWLTCSALDTHRRRGAKTRPWISMERYIECSRLRTNDFEHETKKQQACGTKMFCFLIFDASKSVAVVHFAIVSLILCFSCYVFTVSLPAIIWKSEFGECDWISWMPNDHFPFQILMDFRHYINNSIISITLRPRPT